MLRALVVGVVALAAGMLLGFWYAEERVEAEALNLSESFVKQLPECRPPPPPPDEYRYDPLRWQGHHWKF